MAAQWIQKWMGSDGIGRPALPMGEFFHPLSLLCLTLLVVNDWVFKSSTWAPQLLTGKLSDFAGLLFFPLLLTALLDTLLLGLSRLGLPVDFTLNRSKLGASIGATALVFTLIKLVPTVHLLVLGWFHNAGLPAAIEMDSSDLLSLVSLLGAWKIGMIEIARVPLGRIELIVRRAKGEKASSAEYLEDVLSLGKSPEGHRQLVDSIDNYLQSPSPKTAQLANEALDRARKLHSQ